MQPKKSLGQNFLTNEEVAKKIAGSASLSSKDNVFEIGPGKGILTKYLAEKAGKNLALEIDQDLANKLQKENFKGTEIIEGDILKINLPRLIEENRFGDYKVVANLPYYITSKIIRLFLETKYPPSIMVLMVQKEVGERIVAKDGKESLLSISVKFYANPELLFNVSREKFDPAPEVDSTVIRIVRKKSQPKIDPSDFFSLVHAGFSSKRKMLANNLSAGLHIPKADVISILKKTRLEPEIRAEKLGVKEWINLYENLKKP
jgi:16S rRNA (adenine1518-N6/adenine1519-N6)-dimethyltransferase